MAARAPSQSELDATRALLTQLGLEWVSQSLPELLERAVKEELSLPRFLHLVCQREQEAREERRVRTGLKLSGLPGGKTLDTFLNFLPDLPVDSGTSLPCGAEIIARIH